MINCSIANQQVASGQPKAPVSFCSLFSFHSHEITSTNADYQRALLNQLQYQYQLCNAQLELIKLMGVELVD